MQFLCVDLRIGNLKGVAPLLVVVEKIIRIAGRCFGHDEAQVVDLFGL